MTSAIRRTKGRGASYRFDRGGTPADPGPFIGKVKNNVDPTRMGRLEVYIEQFSGGDEENQKKWRTVSYLPHFYGSTYVPGAGPSGFGTFLTNQQSYGMWFTPPDLGVSVICFFVEGDPNQGYYLGVVPDEGINHMIPAVGASRNYSLGPGQEFLQGSEILPVTEINTENSGITLDPRFFDRTKPVHSYLAGILYQQGLLSDSVRGPITSSSQRETPSAVYGVSTPGRPIYQGGSNDAEIRRQLEAEDLKPQDVAVIGRRGGHSLIMDDGDLTGRDNLIRIRTAKGHQITMSDEADCLYIIAANGQTWIELGSEGTVDVYSTNSVNVRSQGDINLHADKNISINATESLNIKAGNIRVESQNTTTFSSTSDFTAYSQSKIAIKTDGALSMQSDRGGWLLNQSLSLKGSKIYLNGGPVPESITAPKPLPVFNLDDTKWVPDQGWQVQPADLSTIVPRAPTHEPYPYHNKGVAVEIDIVKQPEQPPTPEVAAALGSVADLPVVLPSVSSALSTVPIPGAPGLPTLPGVPESVSQLTSTVSTAAATLTAPLNAALPSGVASAIDSASVLSTKVADIKVGSLDKASVTGLIAQAKTTVAQTSDVVSVDKGIGQFGFKPNQLEASGLLKPGIVSNLESLPAQIPSQDDIAEAARINSEGGDITPEQVAQNRKINQVLSSPVNWTGKSGVNNLQGLLSNQNLQNVTQQNLISKSLDGLKATGLATGNESPQVLSGLIQSASKQGVASLESFVKGSAPENLKVDIAATVKGAQFSTDFVKDKLGPYTDITRRATPAVDTVDRSTVDEGVKTFLGNDKIPAPDFKPVEREPEDPELLSIGDEAKAIVLEIVTFLDSVKVLADEAIQESVRLDALQPLTTEQIDAFSALRDAWRTKFNSSWKSVYIPKVESLETSRYDPVREYADASVRSIARLVQLLRGISTAQKELIEQWRQNASA